MLLITSVHYVPSESKVVREISNGIKPPNAKKGKNGTFICWIPPQINITMKNIVSKDEKTDDFYSFVKDRINGNVPVKVSNKIKEQIEGKQFNSINEIFNVVDSIVSIM